MSKSFRDHFNRSNSPADIYPSHIYVYRTFVLPQYISNRVIINLYNNKNNNNNNNNTTGTNKVSLMGFDTIEFNLVRQYLRLVIEWMHIIDVMKYDLVKYDVMKYDVIAYDVMKYDIMTNNVLT